MDAETATVQLLLIERLKDKEAECMREQAAAAAAVAERDALAAANLALQSRVDVQEERLRLLAGETAALQAKLKQREQFAEAGMITSIHALQEVESAKVMIRERDDSALLKELAGANRELETVKSRFDIAKNMLEKKDVRIQDLEARVAEAEQSAQTKASGEREAGITHAGETLVAHGKEFSPASSVRLADVAEHQLEHAKRALEEKDARIQALEKKTAEYLPCAEQEAVVLLMERERELAGAKRELDMVKSRFEIARSMLVKKDVRIQDLEARVAEAEQSAQAKEGGEGTDGRARQADQSTQE
jgi:hypothetical protein